MSRRSRKRFSGTGGISSGRTTGFSLFALCSFSPSTSSSLSNNSLSTGLPELWRQCKTIFCYAKNQLVSFLLKQTGKRVTFCFFITWTYYSNWIITVVLCIKLHVSHYTSMPRCDGEQYPCLEDGAFFSFFDSRLFFFDRLLFCLLRLRCLCFSSVSLWDSTEENWEDESREQTDKPAEWEVRFLLPSSTVARNTTACIIYFRNVCNLKKHCTDMFQTVRRTSSNTMIHFHGERQQ